MFKWIIVTVKLEGNNYSNIKEPITLFNFQVILF